LNSEHFHGDIGTGLGALLRRVEPLLLQNASSDEADTGNTGSDPFTESIKPFRRVLCIGISFMPL